MSSPKQLDRDWLRKSFLVSAEDLGPIEVRNRFFTTASLKYVDTSPGANVMINPPPQFTRLADIKPKNIRKEGAPRLADAGLYSAFNYGTTLGRYYSEAIDDNAHLVHFQMGKTGYNSVFNYLTGYYSYYASYVARTGRVPGFFYKLGRVAGFVVAVVNWKFVATLYLYRFFKFAAGVPSTKYAFLKPTMPVYWASVQTMVNHIATYMGITTIADDSKFEDGSINRADAGEDYGYFFDNAAKTALSKALPDIFDRNGNLNVYALATKGQRLANNHRYWVKKQLENGSAQFNDHIVALYRTRIGLPAKEPSWSEYMKRWMDVGNLGFFQETKSLLGIESKEDLKSATSASHFLEAEMQDGASFVTFRVEEGGSVSESFSNSATDSELKTSLDSAASNIRSAINKYAGGNILGGNFVGDAINAVGSQVAQFIGGTADSVGLGGLAGVTGGGYADIPQHWESSMSQLPRANWTIKLNTPYNNPISKLVHEIVPLCMLLCMALPHSTGPQSYTGPFMIAYFDKGRSQSRYGMVDSISITRGTASTAFSQGRMYNGIEVSLSVIDLTSVMHMPLTEGFTTPAGTTGAVAAAGGAAVGSLSGLFGGDGTATGGAEAALAAAGGAEQIVKTVSQLFSDDTVFTDYMAVLSALDVADNIYASRRLRNRLARSMSEWRTHYSVPAVASVYGDSVIANIGKSVFRGSEKLF